MIEANRCAGCGGELASDSPQGLCPGCLLKRGLETNTFATADGSATGDYAPPTPEELAAFFPDLEIIELLGCGGMGVVYKARQKRLDRIVALKILSPKIGQDPAFAERFQREAQAMAILSHPHIVAVHDFGCARRDSETPSSQSTSRELYYFIMEYVDGLNLRRLLNAQRLLPEQALAIVPQICDALQYAHDRGVIHRDIKPENILMDTNGRVKIADFGLAKLMRPSESAGQGRAEEDCCGASAPESALSGPAISLTGAGQVMGTPQYMAPEQVTRPQAVDHRADIYSLGVVFYQMLTGELPIGRFAPPSKRVQIDVRLDEVVLRALEKEPQRRYQQAGEIKTQVETIVLEPPADSSAAPSSIVPHLSGAAVAGAVCASIFILFRLGPSAPFHMPILPALGWHWSPPHWITVLGIATGALGAIAPLAATIFGGVALAQIRHSGGRLYGLRLALADTLLFPLLAIDALIGYSMERLFNKLILGPVINDFFVVQTVGLLLIVDALVVWGAWHAASAPLGGFPGSMFGVGQKAPSLISEAAVEEARRHVRGPAIGLILTSVINWLTLVVLTSILLPRALRRGVSPEIFFLVVAILSIGSVVVLMSAIRMQKLESLTRGWIASIVAMIVGPCYLVSWPVGLWSLIVLAQPKVIAAFRARALPDKTIKKVLKEVFVSAFVVVVLIIFVRTFILGSYYAASDAEAPEFPNGSYSLVYKLSRHFIPGNVVVYRENGKTKLAQVIEAGPSNGILKVQHRNEASQQIAKSDLIGKAILNTRQRRFSLVLDDVDRASVYYDFEKSWIRKLPKGEIELVAVSRYPSKGQPWWKPNGLPYTEHRFDANSMTFGCDDDKTEQSYEFMFRLPEDSALSFRNAEPSGRCWGGNGTSMVDGRPMNNYVFTRGSMPKSAHAVSLRFAVASDDWITIERKGPVGSSLSSGGKGDGEPWEINFGEAIEKTDGSSVISATFNKVNKDARIIAIDDKGKENTGSSLGAQVGHTSMVSSTFRNLPLKRIKEFRLQARPYHVLGFPYVSLSPR